MTELLLVRINRLSEMMRRYSVAMYEATDARMGPWPTDPDGGEMRIINALESTLRLAGEAVATGRAHVSVSALLTEIGDELDGDT
ncbi:MAG TPA: hypothetical protein VFW65_31870 [Pseudonocardiaceae bacterium]|nr:hypothetical protein [Pseudonocardiaceae bacterium]